MTTTPETQRSAPRGCLFLRCTRGLLFLSGALAVSYVALTLLHAKLYQEAAGIVLEKQISVQQQHGVTTHKEVACD